MDDESRTSGRVDKYAPEGAVVFSAYWQEHYTVLSHNADGSVTVRWHGTKSGPDGAMQHEGRETTHRTPLSPRDDVVGQAQPTISGEPWPIGAAPSGAAHPEDGERWGQTIDMPRRDAAWGVR